MKKIAFAGTDGRTLLSAFVVSTATSDIHSETFEGIVVRGTPAMPKWVEMMNWPVHFISTKSNSVHDYADTIIRSMEAGEIDYLIPMPEALLFEGLVDRVVNAGFDDRIAGLTKEGAFIEGDKLRCKTLCREAGIPVASNWKEVDAQKYPDILQTSLRYIHVFGGAVLKYPYSAGGKGARIIRNTWEIRDVYDKLIEDYKEPYTVRFGKKGNWPLLIESLMSGVEISFMVLVDAKGHFRILPTSMDYPERFKGPAGENNPITGGVGAISPHPMETQELIYMADESIVSPLINAMRQKGILRPCILYPGCFVSFDKEMFPTQIRVSEVNIRPGEPETQPVVRRLRNFGQLIEAMMSGNLDKVEPEVRNDQISISLPLVTGPGGPDGQKGYPWSCTKGEPMEIDISGLKKKGIQLIPSAMVYDNEAGCFKSDGTRVAFLNANATIKPNDVAWAVAEQLSQKLYRAFDNGKVRVIPREDQEGNRLDVRRGVGSHYLKAAKIFFP